MPKLTAAMIFACTECDPSLSDPPPCIHVMPPFEEMKTIKEPCDCDDFDPRWLDGR